MSKTIDQRVVEMKFDNKDFESNVSTTMSTLEKLKKSLNLEGANKGFEQVNSAANKIDMSGLSGAVENVKNRFSALEVMAITALVNITNSAVNAGKKIVSALTIDPIKTGFQEYETQINAVQTILANTSSKGTSLQQVNGALAELNTYADKTIYNFTEMTRNIGTFTAAGVDLNTSVSAIKGIANLAAVSGSTSQQASTAMYQLSQALASGTVKLQDWNSVVNAGMGGQVFQDALKETARLHGVSIDQMITSEGSFRETLKDGWLTSEILTETLAKFTGDLSEKQLIAMGYTEEQSAAILKMGETANDAATKVKTLTQLIDTVQEAAQSGWTRSWEIIIGDFEEAKEVYTEISDVINGVLEESGNARNELLSKGLSSGWKQLLNEGIKDEELYMRVIKDLGNEHGINFDEMIASTGSFEKAIKKGLSEGVINAEFLEKSIFALGDRIREFDELDLESLGYTQEHVDAIEELVAGIQNGTISMDEYAQKIMSLSGRENIIQAIRNAFEGLVSIITPIKEAFREIFPPATGEQLYNLTVKIKELTEHFTLSEKTSENLKRTFKGLFAGLDIGKQAFTALFNAITSLLGGSGELIDIVLGITAGFGDWVVQLNETIKTSDIFNTSFEKVVTVINTVSDKIKEFISSVSSKINFSGFEGFGVVLDNIKERVSSILDGLKTLEDGASKSFSKMGSAVASSSFVKALELLWKAISKITKDISSALGTMINEIISGLGSSDFVSVIDAVNGVIAAIVGLNIKKFLESATETFSSFQDVTAGVVDVFDAVRGTFEAYQTKLKADVLIKIAGAIAILTASILIISSIDSVKLNTAMGAISLLFAELLLSMSIFSKISGEFTGVMKSSLVMVTMATSILIMAGALKTLSDIDPASMTSGVMGVAALAGVLVIATKAISSGSGTVMKGATQLVIFAGAIKLLASAVNDLSGLNFEELVIGLTGVGVIMGAVAIFLNTTKNTKGAITTATGVVILAAALKILASAVKDFAEIGDWEELKQGLVSIGVLLAEIAIFTKLTGNAQNIISTGAALVIIAASMKIFASAIKDFSEIGDWEDLARGLTGMAGALASVTVAVNLMPKDMISKGLGLTAVAAALVILAKALNDMGNMSWNEIAKGLTTLGGSMAILAIGLNAMTGSLAGSAALLVASAAITVLAPALKSLGSMSVAEIAKSLITLAGAFAVIGVSATILTPLMPTILGLGVAFTLMGVGVLGLGVGLSAVAVGLTALATSVAGGAAAIVASLTVIITGVAALIPAVLTKLGEGVVAFVTAIGNSASAIGKAVKDVLLSLIDVFVEVIPPLVDGILKLITALLESLVEYTPQIVSSIMKFIIEVIRAIGENIPELIVVAVEALMAFFSGIIDALSGIDTEVLLKGIAGIGLLALIMSSLAATAALVPGAMVGILGMAAVIAEMAILLAAIGALAQIPGLNWLINEGSELLSNIGNAIGNFVGSIVGGVMEGVTNSFPQIATNLSTFMTNLQPFIDGARQIDPSIVESVTAIAGVVALLTAAKFIDGLTAWFTGGSSLIKFGEDLVKFGPLFKRYADSVQGIDTSVVEASANAALAIATFSKELPNSGGMVSWFTGDNTLSQFSKELVKFGPSMKQYANSVSGIDTNVVTNSANAAKALSELAKNLPNQGGIISWFTGNNSMSTFGKNLVEFGKAFADYATSVSGVNISSLASVAKEFERLIQLATTIGKIDSSGMSEFAKNLTNLGKAGIDGFIKSFTDANEKVSTTATELMQKFITGAESKKEELLSTFEKFVTETIKKIDDKQKDFNTSGTNLMVKLMEGVKNKSEEVKNSFTKIITDSVNNIRNLQNQFYEAGRYLVNGFANGISANTYVATAKARAMAQAAAQAASKQLQIKSPSRVGYKIGDFFGIGFVNAIEDSVTNSYKAGGHIAEAAKNGLSNAIDTARKKIDLGIDSSPVIRPVIDLSDVNNKSRIIDTIFNKGKVINVTGSNIKNNNTTIEDALSSLRDFLNNNDTRSNEVSINIQKMEVRSEEDIQKIAKELNRMVERNNRGRGIQFA